MILPKNCTNIHKNWLKFEVLDLIKYPLEPDRFALYDEYDNDLCICRFEEKYEKTAKLSGYFSNHQNTNDLHKIFGDFKYLGKIDPEQCEKLSTSDEVAQFSILNTNVIPVERKDVDEVTNRIDDVEEWWHNEHKKITPLDSSYFAPTGIKCYYCDDFEIDSLSKEGKRNYEFHVKSKHGDDLDHSCYPTKADLEKLGLKPQGKSWEI